MSEIMTGYNPDTETNGTKISAENKQVTEQEAVAHSIVEDFANAKADYEKATKKVEIMEMLMRFFSEKLISTTDSSEDEERKIRSIFTAMSRLKGAQFDGLFDTDEYTAYEKQMREKLNIYLKDVFYVRLKREQAKEENETIEAAQNEAISSLCEDIENTMGVFNPQLKNEILGEIKSFS